MAFCIHSTILQEYKYALCMCTSALSYAFHAIELAIQMNKYVKSESLLMHFKIEGNVDANRTIRLMCAV